MKKHQQTKGFNPLVRQLCNRHNGAYHFLVSHFLILAIIMYLRKKLCIARRKEAMQTLSAVYIL